MKKIIVALMACALIAGCKKSPTYDCYKCHQTSPTPVPISAQDTSVCAYSNHVSGPYGGGYEITSTTNGYTYACTK